MPLVYHSLVIPVAMQLPSQIAHPQAIILLVDIVMIKVIQLSLPIVSNTTIEEIQVEGDFILPVFHENVTTLVQVLKVVIAENRTIMEG